MASFGRIVSATEQNILLIIEERRGELDAFIDDDSCEHHAAKALIAFILARHFALKELKNG